MRAAVIAALLILATLQLWADKTTRGTRLRPLDPAAAGSGPALRKDTLTLPPETLVALAGYDKPLNARRESLLVTNHHTGTIISLTITVIYTDIAGRQLHEATVEIPASIPPEATRLVSFPSWDQQNSFFYHLGKQPRTPNVTPYDVTCRVDRIVIHHPDDK